MKQSRSMFCSRFTYTQIELHLLNFKHFCLIIRKNLRDLNQIIDQPSGNCKHLQKIDSPRVQVFLKFLVLFFSLGTMISIKRPDLQTLSIRTNSTEWLYKFLNQNISHLCDDRIVLLSRALEPCIITPERI